MTSGIERVWNACLSTEVPTGLMGQGHCSQRSWLGTVPRPGLPTRLAPGQRHLPNLMTQMRGRV